MKKLSLDDIFKLIAKKKLIYLIIVLLSTTTSVLLFYFTQPTYYWASVKAKTKHSGLVTTDLLSNNDALMVINLHNNRSLWQKPLKLGQLEQVHYINNGLYIVTKSYSHQSARQTLIDIIYNFNLLNSDWTDTLLTTAKNKIRVKKDNLLIRILAIGLITALLSFFLALTFHLIRNY